MRIEPSLFTLCKNGPLRPAEVADLRTAVRWDRQENVETRPFAYYTVRNPCNDLVGYVAIVSDGVAHAFLVDLMVHPDYQQTGIGQRIVNHAVSDMYERGMLSVQVTFSQDLAPFYARCGFHIFGGGIIDFKRKSDKTGHSRKDIE